MNRRAAMPVAQFARGQNGSTLVEILIAVALMGSAIIVMVTGMSTLFASSTQNRQSTTAGVVARDYAEALVIAAAQTGAWCSASYSVPFTAPTGYTVQPPVAYSACPAAGAAQFQTATISVTSPVGLVETLRIVVRQP